MSSRTWRFFGGVLLGAAAGAAGWLQGFPSGSPAFAMSAFALVGGLLGLLTDVTFLPETHEREPEPVDASSRSAGAAKTSRAHGAAAGAGAEHCRHCGAARPTSAVWCASCGRLMTSDETPADVDLSRFTQKDEPVGGPRWTTLVAAVLLVPVATPEFRLGRWLLSRAFEFMSYEGSGFWWGFDALVALLVGCFALFLACLVFGFVVGAVVVAIGLVRRAAWARTYGLCLFLVATLAGIGMAIDTPSVATIGVAVAAVAGAVLLCLPATDADFGGRWGGGGLVSSRRSRWL